MLHVICWHPETFSKRDLHLGHLLANPSSPSPFLSHSKPCTRAATSQDYPLWLCKLHSLQKAPWQTGHTTSLPSSLSRREGAVDISYTPSQFGYGHCFKLPRLCATFKFVSILSYCTKSSSPRILYISSRAGFFLQSASGH